MSIYDSVKNNFIMKDAREDWASYRKSLTDIILGQKPESVMIVGGGRCNDIDLERLLEMAEKVVIVDVDDEAMKEAAAALPEAMGSRVICRVASLTGIQEDFISDFCENMVFHARKAAVEQEPEYFSEQLRHSLDEIEEKLIKSESELKDAFQEDSVDVTVCCGVHSQLFSLVSYFVRSLIYNLREAYLSMAGSGGRGGQMDGLQIEIDDAVRSMDELQAEVDDRIRHMNDRVIPIINRAVYRTAKRTAVFGNEYMPESPVEGAFQCIKDVRERYETEESHLLWEFNRAAGKTYDVLIQKCGKNS